MGLTLPDLLHSLTLNSNTKTAGAPRTSILERRASIVKWGGESWICRFLFALVIKVVSQRIYISRSFLFLESSVDLAVR